MNIKLCAIAMTIPLCACEHIGLSDNSNSIARLEYVNNEGECSVKLTQNGLRVSESVIEEFAISESVEVNEGCVLILQYKEDESMDQ